MEEQDSDKTTSHNIIDTEFSSTTKEDLSFDNDDKNEEEKNEEEKNEEENNEEENNEDNNPITHDKLIETEVGEVNKLSLENQELKKENSLLKESIQSYKNELESLKQQLESQKQHYENCIERHKLGIGELNQKLNDSNKELENCKNHTESYKTEFKKIQAELDIKKKEISDLKTYNAVLKEEASKYQSALGVAANFRISDDKNHSVQLKNDILSLQDAIENYVTNLKGKIEINIKNVEQLSKNYGCFTNTTMEKTEKQNKPFIKAVLQRHVLDVIIKYAKKYFASSGNIVTLESEILMKTTDLCLKLNEFSRARKGTDTITPTSSIKVRQEACVALSNRGFSEIIEENQIIEHDFIEYVKRALNKSLNEYRIINDPAKKQSVENLATNIIREFIKIFWFRLRIQEPTIKSTWVNPHTKIDPIAMTGRWEEGEDVNNLVVDLCYFPIIGLNLNDPSKRKLYTRAKVFPRYQEQSYASSLFKKGCDMVKNVMTTNDQSESSTQQVGHDSNETSNRIPHEGSDQNQEQT